MYTRNVLGYSFIHIPKTSGWRIRQELFEHLKFPQQQAKYWSDFESFKFSETFFGLSLPKDPAQLVDRSESPTMISPIELRQQYENRVNFCGHITLNSGLRAGYRVFCSLIREPRARLLSDYLFHRLGGSEVHSLPSNATTSIAAKSSLDKFIMARIGPSNSLYEHYLRPKGRARMARYHLELFWSEQATELLRTCFQVTPSSSFDTDIINSITRKDTFASLKLDSATIQQAIENPLFRQVTSLEVQLLQEFMDIGALDYKDSRELDREFDDYVNSMIT